MCQEFEWSRATFASALTLGTLCLGSPSPLIGILVARFGARKMPFFSGIWCCYLFGCYVPGDRSMAGLFIILHRWFRGRFRRFRTGYYIANNWFVKKRALAFGITAGLMGLGGFIIPPLIRIYIDSFGWRISWLALAGMVFCFQHYWCFDHGQE